MNLQKIVGTEKFFEEHVVRFLSGVCVGLALSVFIYPAPVQGQNRLDRPKDSQELCGYTLKDGQVERVNDTTVRITLNIVVETGSALDYVKPILEGPVCAFGVDNPGLTDIGIAAFDVRSPSHFAPIRVKPEVVAVIVTFRKK